MGEEYRAELTIHDHSLKWEHDSQVDLTLKCRAKYPRWIKSVKKILEKCFIDIEDLVEMDVTIEHPNQPPRTRTLWPGDILGIHHIYHVDFDIARTAATMDLSLEKQHFPLNIKYKGMGYTIKEYTDGKLKMKPFRG